MWLLRIALAGLTAAAIGSVAGAAEPVKIRISWTAPVSNWGSLLLEKKDIARHLGRSYDLVPIRKRSQALCKRTSSAATGSERPAPNPKPQA
jgi:hypothetical protein